MSNHLGMMFSTNSADYNNGEDNDKSGRVDCAGCMKAGWWFNSCLDGPHNVRANLNGPYGRFTGELDSNGKRTCYDEDIVWAKWKGDFETLQFTEMKIKPYAN